MKRVLVFATLTLAVASGALAQVANKVAVIDVDRLVQESAAGKEALANLQKVRDQKVAEGKQMQADLQALQQQLATQQATLSQEKIAALQKQIEDKQVSLQRFQEDTQQQLNEAQDKEYSRLNDQLMPVISQVGKEKGLLMIFNKYRSGLLYADDAVDITDEVLRRFNTTVTK